MLAATSSNFLSPIAWGDVARDVRDGAIAMTRMLVTAVGTVALVLAALALNHSELRDTVIGSLWTATDATEVASTEQTAPAAPAAAEQPESKNTAATDPRQKHVVQYLARRYRVAEEATRMLVATAFQIGQETRLDPLLILSVVAIESSLNPFAESSMGAQGLMQVMTRVHADRFESHGGQLAALDPVANMKVGSAILSDLITRGGSVERGLQLYVGAGNMPDDGGYGARVLSERARLALAASGKVDAAIAAARTAVASEQKPAAVQPAAPTVQPVAIPVAPAAVRADGSGSHSRDA